MADEPSDPGVSRRRLRPLLVGGCLVLLASVPVWRLGSVFLGLLVLAISLLALAPFLEPRTRRVALVLASVYLLPAGCVLGSDGFLNYRVSRLVVYRAETAGPLRGVAVETIVSCAGHDTRLLPGLTYTSGKAPHGVHVFLHDDGSQADRARVDDAYVMDPRTGERLALDLRREVRWSLESRTFEDGWIPFQKGWRSPQGGDLPHGRCGLRDRSPGVDLEALGDPLLLVMDVQLDKVGSVSRHRLEIPLRRHVEWGSGIVVQSP